MGSIQTRRLLLRPYQRADWEDFRSLVQDSEVMWRLAGALSLESAERLFERLIPHDVSSGVLAWAVTARADGEYRGHVFIDRYDEQHRSAELGFVLHKAFHGQRLGAEMAGAAYQYALNRLGCAVVTATVDADNEASKAVLARIGMFEITRETDDDGVYIVYGNSRPV